MFRIHALSLFTVLVSLTWAHVAPGQSLQGVIDGPDQGQLPVVELSSQTTLSPGQNLPIQPAAAVSVENAIPSLSVKTSGPETLVVGRPATYTVLLKNHSGIAANQTEVRISLPAWVELQQSTASHGNVESVSQGEAYRPVLWRIPRVPAQATSTMSITVLPLSGKAFDLNVDLTVRPSEVQREITIQEPLLSVETKGPTNVVLGETAEWQVVVSNPGTGVAQDVKLQVLAGYDDLANASIGNLAPEEQRVLNLQLTPGQVGPDSIEFVVDGQPHLTARMSRDYVVRRPELSVEVAGPPFEYAGTTAKYIVHVRNTGDAPAHQVTAEMVLPPGAVYLRGVQNAEVASDAVRWMIDRVAAGEEKVFEVMYELTQGGSNEFVVMLHSTWEEIPRSATVTDVRAIADLKLEVDDPKGPRAVGSSQDYEIRVTNQGTDVARQITIIAVCSPEVEPIGVSGQAAVQSGQIFFRPIDQLLPGQTVTRKVSARALEAGNFVFRVVVKCYEPEARLAAEDTTRFFTR